VKYSLPALALKRPVAVVMLSLSLMVLGGIAWVRMPLQFLPDINQPFVGTWVPYPGATPEQIEQQVAIPVEGEFRTIPGIHRLETHSQSDGCWVSMLFTLDTDIADATAEVRDRIERLKLVLPPEIERIHIQRFSTASFPVMAFGIFRMKDQEDFVHLVRTVLEPRLRRVDGVADIQIMSPVPEKDVLIEFDQDMLRSLRLDMVQVISTLRDSSLNLSVGRLKGGGKQFFVRVQGEYRRLQDIRELVVGNNGLQLQEVASVEFKAREEQQRVSMDGKGGAYILITKESEANIVSTCEAVQAELDRVVATAAFEGVDYIMFLSQAELITRVLHNLVKAGLYGGAMSLLVLFFFLHRLRPTIIVALTIPTSLVFALVFMFFSTITLNAVSMLSMIIAVGMLVDNSIVVAENIIRHHRMGLDAMESARRGASEVSLAILASTVTTWVVFIPMFYLEAGEMSVMMTHLGLPLIISLGGSLLIAQTVIPLAMSRMAFTPSSHLFGKLLGRFSMKASVQSPVLEDKAPSFLKKLAGLKMIQRGINGYGWCLGWSLKWRLVSLLLLVAMGFLTWKVPMQNLDRKGSIELDMRELSIRVDMDQNYDFEHATELFTLMEERINALRDELGIRNVMKFYSKNDGQLGVYLYTEDDGPEWATPPYTTLEVSQILAEYLPKYVPGAEVNLSSGRSGGAEGQQDTISIRMRGDDTQLLELYAERFAVVMEDIENLSNVTNDLERNRQEIQIKIDDPLADRAGVGASSIAQTVFLALGGTRLPYLKQGNREIPVWAQFREEDRKSRANLDTMAVPGFGGNLIPMNELVEYSKAHSARSIRRVNGKRVIRLIAQTATEDRSRILADLHKAKANFEMPVGYQIELDESLQEMEDEGADLMATILMAVVLVYIVMSALFESCLLPMCILTSVPLAFAGVSWMLYITRTGMDTITSIGQVLMIGLIVNNGIVIVDHINTLRKEGLGAHDAIVQSGIDRFRPVMMTALTTILGLIPLAIASTGGSAAFAGLGRAIIGGLTAGTILTLFVVPLFYSLIDGFQTWVVNFLGNLVSLGGGKGRKA
jgi:HAE1 family hydrophobic/amphiphilic exporter-1